MNKEFLPINEEPLSKEQSERLLSLSRGKAGIKPGKSTAVRVFIAVAAVVGITAAAVGSAVLFGDIPAAANEDDGLPYRIINNALHVGKYYADGDTSASYIEIYDDGTLQWKGIDHFEFAKRTNIEHGALYGREWDEELAKASAELAEEYAARHTYTVVYWKGIGETMVMYDWSEDSEHLGGTGCVYIDENTIEAYGMIFIYTEE